MTAIRGVFGAVDELGAAYQNSAEDVRAMVFHALGGTEGILEGFVMSTVAGAMEVDFSAGRALVAEGGVDLTAEDRGYYVFADDVTTVPFEAASVADRKDAVVFAWVDPQYGALGSGVTVAGPQIVVVKGVSGSTVARTDAEIQAAIGVGGWLRYADVLIDSTDTEINPANITLTYTDLDPDPATQVGYRLLVEKTADESLASSTTIQNDDQLSFAVEAGGTYHIDLWIYSTGPGGIQFRFNYPATSSSLIVWEPSGRGVGGSVNRTTSGTSGVFNGFTTDPNGILIRCRLQAGAAGTFRLQWAQNASNASPTIVKDGSHMQVERVG